MNKLSRILLSGAVAVAATTGLVATAPAASAQCDYTGETPQVGYAICESNVDGCQRVVVYYRAPVVGSGSPGYYEC